MDLTTGKGKTALKIIQKLKDAGFLSYFAGGCVRDYLLGKEPEDFDIATTATPDEVERVFSKTIPIGKQFGVLLIVEDGDQFEVATFRSEDSYVDGRRPEKVEFTGPEEDAKRRDFTVNGLFYDPIEKKVIDFVGGVEDLKKKIVKAIGDPEKRFEEDKLRLLRAVRFAANLDFPIENSTWNAILLKAKEITKVSAERIREELVKIFTRPGAAKGYMLLSDSGLMKVILPEIEDMKGVKQPPEYHPEGDVFRHTFLLIEELSCPSPTLAFGALLHDIGKPPTFVERKGRPTFYEHASVGAKMTKAIMKRLRFSNDDINLVCDSVFYHMKFGDVQKMRSGKLKQFVSRNNFLEELELHRIDCIASHRKLDNYEFLNKKLEEYKKEELKPKAFVTGNDLIELGMKPGPKMKPILEELYVLQLEGKYKNKDEALKWAKQKIKK